MELLGAALLYVRKSGFKVSNAIKSLALGELTTRHSSSNVIVDAAG